MKVNMKPAQWAFSYFAVLKKKKRGVTNLHLSHRLVLEAYFFHSELCQDWFKMCIFASVHQMKWSGARAPSVSATMSSSACCSAPDADAYACHWNCDHGFKCDLTVKANVPTRRKREFTPDELKDDNYWMKRSRNNEAAKRSRERRRMEERLLEERALQLLRENEKLKAALSAINYYGAGKETSHSAFMDYSPVRELPRDSYLRSLVNFPGAHRIPHYSLSSRCDFSAGFDSLPLPRMQSFPAASFPTVDSTHQRDRYLGIHAPRDGNISSSACSNLPYAITQRKWGQDHVRATVNFYSNSAPLSQNEMVPGSQCTAGTSPTCAAHTRMNETYVERRSFVNEPKDICKEMEMVNEAGRVSTSPLLPHKLRYKINKARRGGERALCSPETSHYGQD